MSDITSQSLTQLVKNIKTKKLSSEDVTKAFVARSEKSKELNVSSLHFNFLNNPEKFKKQNEEILIRQGIQFHWKNNDYKDFDDFLKSLSSRKRKLIKKERKCIEKNTRCWFIWNN